MQEKEYNDIMKIAFEAEEAIDEHVKEKFGREFPDKTILIKEGDTKQEIYWLPQNNESKKHIPIKK